MSHLLLWLYYSYVLKIFTLNPDVFGKFFLLRCLRSITMRKLRVTSVVPKLNESILLIARRDAPF